MTETTKQSDVERVTYALQEFGIKATYEYPGFILFPMVGRDDRMFAAGIANATWGVDLQAADGSETYGSVDTGIPSTSQDVEAIRRAIVRAAMDLV